MAVTLVLKLLDLFIVGSMTYARAMELKARIETMQAEGRDPTDAEWQTLFDQIDVDSARLDAAAKGN